MISTTAKYALRAAVCLASENDSFVRRSIIAQTTKVPKDYLLKVLNELDAAGVVVSRRGPGGGYRLAVDATELTALDVVLAVDQVPRIKACPLGIASHRKLCPLHQLLDNASLAVEEAFRGATIADLIPKRKSGRTCNFPKVND